MHKEGLRNHLFKKCPRIICHRNNVPWLIDNIVEAWSLCLLKISHSSSPSWDLILRIRIQKVISSKLRVWRVIWNGEGWSKYVGSFYRRVAAELGSSESTSFGYPLAITFLLHQKELRETRGKDGVKLQKYHLLIDSEPSSSLQAGYSRFLRVSIVLPSYPIRDNKIYEHWYN